MNVDSLAGTVFGALILVGSLIVAGGTTLVARYTYSTAGSLPLTIVGAALITWRIVAGWTSGWCGARIRRDLRAGNVSAYSAILILGIAGLVLWGGFYLKMEIPPERSATLLLQDLVIYSMFAYVFTMGVVVALYCCCLIYYLRKHGIPPAQPPASV